MALKAAGTGGACTTYIEGIKAKLDELRIADPAVDAMWDALSALRMTSRGADRPGERLSCTVARYGRYRT